MPSTSPRGATVAVPGVAGALTAYRDTFLTWESFTIEVSILYLAMIIVGGLGTIDFPPGGGSGIKGTPLMVDGTLYVSTPDNAWAIDARDGREKWRTEICDLEQFYYASAAPLIVGNHVIVGVSGDDLDIPDFLR